MAIETKDILEYLGMEGVDSFDKFRQTFEPAFIKKSLIKEDKELFGSLVGKVTGSTRTALVSDLKKKGIELTSEEIKDMQIEKIVEHGLQKLEDFYKGKIADVEKNAKPDQAIEEWKNKYEAEKRKIVDSEILINSMKEKYATDIAKATSDLGAFKMKVKEEEAYGGIKWRTGIKDIEKRGFYSMLNDKYKKSIDEQDKLVFLNPEGQKIPDPKKNGEWKSVSAILEEEGKAAGVWEVNPVAQRGRPEPVHQEQVQQPAFTGRPRILSEAALSVEGRK